MAGKENDDFELNLKDADGGVGSIDALLAADGNDAPAAGGNGNADDDDDFIDFNDFSKYVFTESSSTSALTIWIRR